MAIDFPASPTNGQTFTSGSVTYTWDGTKWTAAAGGGGASDKIEEGNTSAEVIDTGSDGRFVVTTEGSERARVDSSGRLLLGTSTARSNVNIYSGDRTPTVQVETAVGSSNNGLALVNNNGSGWEPVLTLAASAGSTVGSNTVVTNNSAVGSIVFAGNDGDQFLQLARITAQVDGAPGNNDMPGRLTFHTTADGASSPTERMRIKSDGELRCCYDPVGNISSAPESSQSTTGTLLGATSGSYFQLAKQGNVVVSFNRQTNDGAIVSLRQDGTEEGTISVSGTTVSYNGAHLSRWSQLPAGAERTEILRGSVLSNIDEMCEWNDEENEQLNRMKVSDVEGDKNVSGVFQAWDDDDDTYTNDFYCAMTGDFVIRIGAGVTVERGDLLMSAGDGTAKPQDDDIIRSKTIAKVTSTNVTCTYDDGSYCVPCVLMAC